MRRRKNIAILGSTGSIGTSSLDVIAHHPERFRVSCLTGHNNVALLLKQIQQFRPDRVVVHEERNATALRTMVNGAVEVLSGEDGLRTVVTHDDVDIVVSSLVGFAGLKPTYWAVEAGKDVALANKETLVVGGSLIMEAVRRHHVQLLPVDSEHSAILQCLQGEDIATVDRLILTASGGPFLNVPQEQFGSIRKEQALNHPTWKMGRKITIDSATLMNKGLEVIEAHWLFGLPAEKIQVVIHPQSIIHSMVEFADGSIKAQLGVPDMKLPIQYALTYPERPAADHRRLDFGELKQMTFLRPDMEKFRCLSLAYRALITGGTAPVVLNAANEVAVQLFLEDRLPFAAIPAVIEAALDTHVPLMEYTLEDLVRIDAEARQAAKEYHSTVV